MVDLTTKIFFYDNGYCVLKKILSPKEIKNLSQAVGAGLKKKNVQKINYFNEDDKFWSYISNKKILDSLSILLNDKVFFMDGGFSKYDLNSKDTNEDKISWHRDTDSAPKIKKKVPYCEENDYYKVFTVMTYVNENNKNSISLIPKTHKSNYRLTFNNLLRIFHWKTKNKKNFSFLRNFIEKMISKKITVESGDCLIFFVGLFHKPISPQNFTSREAIITRYAPKSKNSENYINYVMKNSSRLHYTDKEFLNLNRSKEFIEFLKKEKLFYF